MKNIMKIIISALIAILFTFSVSAETVLPYENYTYSEKDSSIIINPQAYVPEAVVRGRTLGVGDFSNCLDLEVDQNDNIYVLDSGNNRVVAMTSSYELIRVYEYNFTDNGEKININGAQGIFLDEKYIYLCDTENARIIITKISDGSLFKIVHSPESSLLDEDFVFRPKRIVVDSDYDIYVVSEGTFEGVINMDINGNFLGFFASNKVSTSSWDLFWRRFSTKEQREAMEQLVPQDFSSIALDDSGFFLITTSKEINNSMVKRVNLGGGDVIRKLSNISIVGDPKNYSAGDLLGLSSFIDISAGSDKIYACLDTTRNKVFCYNNDGYLLYTFGCKSDSFGGFSAPKALTYLKDDKIAVLDGDSGSFTVFAATEYGKAINKGIHLQTRLEYNKAIEQWEVVLKQNSNYQLAENMIAKSFYDQGEYEKAMEYFESVGNKSMYSTVKKAYRKVQIRKNLKPVMTVILCVTIITVIVIMLFKIFKKRGKSNG